MMDKNALTQTLTKMTRIEQELNQIFFERAEEIHSLIQAVLLREHVLLLGRWGTGKSALVRELAARLTDEADSSLYFEYMMNRTSDPSALAGPYALSSLKQDRFRRTGGGITTAQVAFLDEVFKSNGPVIDFLLPILNERIWHNDDQVLKVPLRTAIMASNEGPDDEMLAFYDRILFRHQVEPVKDYGNKLAMWQHHLHGSNKATKTTITLKELDLLGQLIPRVTVTDDVLIALSKVLLELEAESITPSDRRTNKALRVLQLEALLNGRSHVCPDDLTALRYVLGEDVSQVSTVQQAINQIVNIAMVKLEDIHEQLEDVRKLINDLPDDDDVEEATELINTLSILKKKTTDLRKDTSRTSDLEKIAETKREVSHLIDTISQDYLHIDGELIKTLGVTSNGESDPSPNDEETIGAGLNKLLENNQF